MDYGQPPDLMSVLGGNGSQGEGILQALSAGIHAAQGTPNPAQQQQAQVIPLMHLLLQAQGQQGLERYRTMEVAHQQATEKRLNEQAAFTQSEAARKTQKDDLTGRAVILDSLLTGPHALQDVAVRGPLAQQWADTQSQRYPGLQFTPGVVGALAEGGIKHENQKLVAQWLAAADQENDPNKAASLETTAQNFYLKNGGTASDWPQAKQFYSSPLGLNLLGIPTGTKLLADQAESQKKIFDSFADRNPRFKDTPTLKGITPYADDFVQSMYQRGLADLNPKNAQDAQILDLALSAAQDRAERTRGIEEARALRIKKAESDIIEGRETRVGAVKSAETLQRQKDLLDYKQTLEPKPLSPTQRRILIPPNVFDDVSVTNLRMMGQAAVQANKDGYLPTDKDLLSKGAAWLTRLKDPNDPNLLLLRQLTGEEFIGKIARGLNDEKGQRGLFALREQTNIIRDNPTLEGYQKLLGYYNYLYWHQASNQVRSLQYQEGKLPADVLEEAQDRLKEMFPKGPPPDPMAAPIVPSSGPLALPPPPPGARRIR